MKPSDYAPATAIDWPYLTQSLECPDCGNGLEVQPETWCTCANPGCQTQLFVLVSGLVRRWRGAAPSAEA